MFFHVIQYIPTYNFQEKAIFKILRFILDIMYVYHDQHSLNFTENFHAYVILVMLN